MKLNAGLVLAASVLVVLAGCGRSVVAPELAAPEASLNKQHVDNPGQTPM